MASKMYSLIPVPNVTFLRSNQIIMSCIITLHKKPAFAGLIGAHLSGTKKPAQGGLIFHRHKKTCFRRLSYGNSTSNRQNPHHEENITFFVGVLQVLLFSQTTPAITEFCRPIPDYSRCSNCHLFTTGVTFHTPASFFNKCQVFWQTVIWISV